jgi:hypothetical protein
LQPGSRHPASNPSPSPSATPSQEQVATTATEEEKEMELGCGPSVHSGDENELRHSRLVVVFFFFFFFTSLQPGCCSWTRLWAHQFYQYSRAKVKIQQKIEKKQTQNCLLNHNIVPSAIPQTPKQNGNCRFMRKQARKMNAREKEQDADVVVVVDVLSL